MNRHFLTVLPHLSITGALCLLLFSQTCRLAQPSVPNMNDLVPVIEMEKGPCYGTCPVYKIAIHTDRTATFRGERYTNKNGVWAKKLAVAEYDELVRTFREANLWKYQSTYKSQLPDLQTVTLRYYQDGDSKEIVGKDGRPEPIMVLEEKVERIANSGGWFQVEAGAEGAPGSNGSNDTVGELIVEFADGVDPEVWALQYSKQEMKIGRKVSPRNAYYVVSFNPQIIPASDLLNIVRRDPYVLGAQLNTPVNGR